MPITSNFGSIRAVRGALRLLVCCALLLGIALSQVDQNRPGGAPAAPTKNSVADAMSRLKQGDFFPADVDLIAKIRGVQAIPDLKKQFELTQDQVSKASIASALVRLGTRTPLRGTT